MTKEVNQFITVAEKAKILVKADKSRFYQYGLQDLQTEVLKMLPATIEFGKDVKAAFQAAYESEGGIVSAFEAVLRAAKLPENFMDMPAEFAARYDRGAAENPEAAAFLADILAEEGPLGLFPINKIGKVLGESFFIASNSPEGLLAWAEAVSPTDGIDQLTTDVTSDFLEDQIKKSLAPKSKEAVK